MKAITKQLTVSRLEMRHRFEGKYVLTLSDPSAWPEAESTGLEARESDDHP